MIDNIKKTLIQWQIDMGHPGEDWMFTFNSNDQKNLVICLGDSWTWGDSLVDRENEMFGKLVADHYNADLINVGCPGWSNSWILLNGEVILTELMKDNQYENVYVIITLTENARDIKTVKSFDFLYWVYILQLSLTKDLYDKILDLIETQWKNQINNLLKLSDDRFTFFIGQNFVWHNIYDKLNTDPRVIITDVNWIEVLADAQKISRPIRTNLVTGWVFDSLNMINTDMSITDLSYYKEYTIPLIEKAVLVNNWLDTSSLNHSRASKHPTASGHQYWADHIIQKINNHLTSKAQK